MGKDTLFELGKMRIYNSQTPIPIHQISELDGKTNRLGKMGAEICCEMNNTRRKKDYLLPYLSGLRIDYGWHLDSTTTLNMDDIGDVSKIFAVNEEGVKDNPMNFKKRFRVIDEDGFWQMYLLENSSTVMPTWWHGNYILRGYVFTLEDIKYLDVLTEEEKRVLSQKRLLLPQVRILDKFNERSATVKATYWNDWEGLCRETVKITLDRDRRVESIKTIKRDVLVEYECGILF